MIVNVYLLVMSGMRSNQFNVKCVSCIVKMKWTHWRRVPVSGIDAMSFIEQTCNHTLQNSSLKLKISLLIEQEQCKRNSKSNIKTSKNNY